MAHPSIVSNKLKEIYKTYIFSLSELSYIKNKYNLTDFGVFISVRASLRHSIGLDSTAFVISHGSGYLDDDIEYSEEIFNIL